MHSPAFVLWLLSAAASATPTAPEKTCIPSSVNWIDCSKQHETPGLKCANITVPVDYSKPCNGQTVRLALAMQPARKPSKRIGPLFFNTGGPGDEVVIELFGNGTGVVPFPSEIRDRFDIVGMDPRGIGYSEPIHCNHTAFNEMGGLNQFPDTDEDFDATYDASRRFLESCIEMTGPLIFNLDSKTVATDLETVRSALGVGKMTYIGLSYGTIIGQAYLELFPDNVRALVLDGCVEHSQRQPYAIATENRGTQDELLRFFDWCDTDSSCILHNRKPKTEDIWNDLIKLASHTPIPAPGCSGPSASCAPTVPASQILYQAQQALLIRKPIPASPFLDVVTWPALAGYIDEAYYNHNATLISRGLATSDSESESFILGAVFRNDWNISITNLVELKNLQQLLNATLPYTRGLGTFYQQMLQSIAWPHPPTFPEGVATFRRSDTPALLVNAIYDPESPYDWAVALQNEIPDSVLLTRNGDGHISYWLRGEAYDVINRYMLDLVLPAPNSFVDS